MHYVSTLDALERLVEDYLQLDAWAFDVETRATDDRKNSEGNFRTNDVFWLSLAGPGRADVIPLGHPTGRLLKPERVERLINPETGRPKKFKLPAEYGAPPPQLSMAEAAPVLKRLFFSDAVKIGHNVKFDLKSIAKYFGEVPSAPYFDTLIAAKLIDENYKRTTDSKEKSPYQALGKRMGYGLDDCLHRAYGSVGDHHKKMKKLRSQLEKMAFDDVRLYSYLDAKSTWLLYRRYKRQLRREGQDSLMDLEMQVLECVIAMEMQGTPIDIEQLEKLNTEYSTICAELQAQIEEYNGGPITLSNRNQIAEFVYKKRGHEVLEKTKKDKKPSTKKKTLEVIAKKDPAVALILEFTKYDKLVNNWLKTLREQTIDGWFYSNFDQMGTVTGRFSSGKDDSDLGTNLQNIPSRTEQGLRLRTIFKAPPGYKLIAADYSQIELRVFAHFTKDPVLRRAYEEGLDLHTLTARKAYGIPESKPVPTAQRLLAKNVNFSVIYLGTPWTISTRYEVPEKEAEKVVNGFYKLYQKARPWQQMVIRTARSRYQSKDSGKYVPPYVLTALGRKRRLPHLVWSDESWRSSAQRQAVNAVIQGTAADIAKLAMVDLHRRTRGTGIQLIMVVHDEFVALAPEDKAEEALALVTDAMTSANMLEVAMEVEAKIVDRWSEMK